MTRARVLRSSPPALGGRAVALLVLVMVGLGALPGTSFSTHMGMSVAASEVGDRHQVHVSAPVSTVSETASEPTVVEGPVSVSPETQQLMHVLGAWLALLVVALVLVPLLRRLDVLARDHPAVRGPAGLPTSRWARQLTIPDPLTASAVLRI